MKMQNILFIVLSLICVCCLSALFPEESQAAVEGVIPKIIGEFQTKTDAWSNTLQGYALRLFKISTTLTVVLFGVKAVLNRDKLGDVIGQFVSSLLFCSFVAAVIVNYQEWSWNIIRGLGGIAEDMGAGKFNSTDPLIAGIKITSVIFDKLDFDVKTIAYLICGIIILIAFSLMTAQLVLVKCEALVAMNASIILLGLGGAVILKEYAISVMKYVLSVAFKLYVLQLVMGLGLQFIQDLSVGNGDIQDFFVAIAASIILLALVKSIPDVCAGIINGSHVNSGAALGQAVTTTVAGAAAAVGGAVGAAMGSGRGIEATRKAAQMAHMDGATGLGKVGHMAGSLWQAHKQAKAEGGKLSHGERFGAALNSRLQEMKMRNLGLADGANPEGKDRSGNG